MPDVRGFAAANGLDDNTTGSQRNDGRQVAEAHLPLDYLHWRVNRASGRGSLGGRRSGAPHVGDDPRGTDRIFR